MLGCDVRDGTVAQLTGFRNATGVTYPLLLNCYLNLGPTTENFVRWYGDRDNFVVINKQGIVRYRAAQTWPYGNGYHLDEIRGCVDSLVTVGLDAGTPAPHAIALAAAPNPAFATLSITLALPRDVARARVAVLDLAGRRVAGILDGAAPAGSRTLGWDLRDDSGARVAPGVYQLLADLDGERHALRFVVIR